MTKLSILLLFLAGALAALAAISGPNIPTAVPLAFGAVGLAGLFGLLEMLPRIRRPAESGRSRSAPSQGSGIESDSLLGLRRAFRRGSLGRRWILGSLQSLERDLVTTGRVPLTSEEETSLLAMPEPEFRAWLKARLDVLEAHT